MADAFGIAVGGIEGDGSFDEAVEVRSQRPEVANRLVDLIRARPEQIEHVTARRLPVVAERQDAADLSQGEADGLGRPDCSNGSASLLTAPSIPGHFDAANQETPMTGRRDGGEVRWLLLSWDAEAGRAWLRAAAAARPIMVSAWVRVFMGGSLRKTLVVGGIRRR